MGIVKWLFVAILMLFIIIPATIFGVVTYKKHTLEVETRNYLISKGYEEEDVAHIHCTIKKLSLFTAEVTFTDEPDVVYQYKKDEGTIIQIGISDSQERETYKHLEQLESD